MMAGFADRFDFRRSRAATYRNANGAPALAAVDQPRFDHDATGQPIGLIVDAGPELGQQDRVMLRAAIAIDGAATVLHAITRADGSIERHAYYTRDATATVQALLGVAARHRAIGAVAGFLPRTGTVVRYRGRDWSAPGVIVTPAGAPIGTTTGPFLAN